MLIIPALDLRGGRCVRLVQGRKSAVTAYDSDPVEVALGFERAGAGWLHLVDLDGAFSDPNSRNREVLREIIRAVGIPLQFGGGLRSRGEVEEVFELGVTRAVVGTLAVESPGTLETLVRAFGGGRVAVGIDARGGRVLTRGWEREGNLSALALARRVAALGVERIVYTDVARDGMLEGVNVEETCRIASQSGLRVTASGGVASLEDLRRLRNAGGGGVDSVIVGKALYDGRFTLREALAALSPTRGGASPPSTDGT